MCGRYAINSDADFVAKLFGLAEIPEFLKPRFNIAPSQKVPVIIAPESFTDWLASDTPLARLKELLSPYPSSAMEAFAVSSYVSKASNEGPKCIEPLAR